MQRLEALPSTLTPIDVIVRLDRAIRYSRCLLDHPVKPGDDSKVCVNLNDKCQAPIPSMWGAAYSMRADLASTTTPAPEFGMLSGKFSHLNATG